MNLNELASMRERINKMIFLNKLTPEQKEQYKKIKGVYLRTINPEQVKVIEELYSQLKSGANIPLSEVRKIKPKLTLPILTNELEWVCQNDPFIDT